MSQFHMRSPLRSLGITVADDSLLNYDVQQKSCLYYTIKHTEHLYIQSAMIYSSLEAFMVLITGFIYQLHRGLVSSIYNTIIPAKKSS